MEDKYRDILKKVSIIVSGLVLSSNMLLAQQEIHEPQLQPQDGSHLQDALVESQGLIEEAGFKQTLMDRVDEKLSKIDELERKISEQELQNQLNQANIGTGPADMGMNNLFVPMVVGTTIISNGKKIIHKEALSIDSMGNKFILNEKNNNVIQNINSDYIVFKESRDRFPVLTSNPIGDSNSIELKSDGVSSAFIQVPESIKYKAENSSPTSSLQENSLGGIR